MIEIAIQIAAVIAFLLLPLLLPLVVYGTCRLIRRQWETKKQLRGVPALVSGCLLVAIVWFGMYQAVPWLPGPGPGHAAIGPAFVAVWYGLPGGALLLAGLIRIGKKPLLPFVAVVSLLTVAAVSLRVCLMSAIYRDFGDILRAAPGVVFNGAMAVFLLSNWRRALARRLYLVVGFIYLMLGLIPLLLILGWIPFSGPWLFSPLLTPALPPALRVGVRYLVLLLYFPFLVGLLAGVGFIAKARFYQQENGKRTELTPQTL